jgi:phosphatidylcholine synthase
MNGSIFQWRFLIHLWTLAGLAFAMIAAQRLFANDLDAAARWLVLVLLVDHSDGTLARRFDVRRHLPRISGETLDLVTDVIGLTFVPMLFCWRADVFLPGWGAALAVAAAVTCSLKYATKTRVLEDGYSLGAPPAFLSVVLFWLLELPPLWATAYTVVLIGLCWLPLRYPITSLVTTHWKPGFESLTTYLAVAAIVPALIWLQDAPAIVYWPALVAVSFQLVVAPVLLAVGIVRPGFRRVY